MIVGFIGLGMGGKAVHDVIQESFQTTCYDIRMPETKIEDVLVSDAVFIAVPTLPDKNNRCDLSILRHVIQQLTDLQYRGVICIKSTIIPGTTDSLIREFDNPRICFCPEFLRERCAYEDFKYNNHISLIGTEDNQVFDVMRRIHVGICPEIRQVKPVEAELTKYCQNVYNTHRILFANAFFEVCRHHGVEYNKIIDHLLVRHELDEKYMRCSDDLRGPSGPCLVKDTLAFNEHVKSLNLPVDIHLFQTLVHDMRLYPRTVITGTRTEKEYFGTVLNHKNN